MEIVMSGHALKQARERGVSINEIKDAIKCGAKSLQNGKIISAYRHVKIVFKIEEAEKKAGLFGLSREGKIGYSGNSLIIRIPKEIAKFMNLKKEAPIVIY